MKKITKKIVTSITTMAIMCSAACLSADAKYDGNKAATYAKKYAENYNSYYKAMDADCSNFVSQCLRDGGFTMSSVPSGAGYNCNNETSNWYHMKYTVTSIFGTKSTKWKWSTTWSMVDKNTSKAKGLYQYLTNTVGIGTSRSSVPSYIIHEAKIGDVIQVIPSGESVKKHSVIVTGKKSAQYGIPDIQVSYHTSNRCNVSFKDFFAPAYGSGTTYVLIHTTNY